MKILGNINRQTFKLIKQKGEPKYIGSRKPILTGKDADKFRLNPDGTITYIGDKVFNGTLSVEIDLND